MAESTTLATGLPEGPRLIVTVDEFGTILELGHAAPGAPGGPRTSAAPHSSPGEAARADRV